MNRPNFFQRAAIRFLGLKSYVNLVESWKDKQPQYPEINFENMVRFGWRKNELIFACISAKSGTASQVSLRPYSSKDRKFIDDKNHPLAKLLQSPNPYMSEYDLWSSVIIYQELGGRAIFEKQRNFGGQVIALYPLRPDWVFPIPSQNKMIALYKYEVPGLEPVYLDPNDVLDFKLFDPINLFHSYPPVAVAARIGDVDNSTTDFIKLFFQEGGAPLGLIKTTQRLRDAEAEEIRKRWAEKYGGARNWAEPAVLDRDAEYQRIGANFQEMGFETLDARNESRICAVMRVPPIIVNAKVGLDRSTFANYKEARTAWWEDVLVPVYQNFLDVIQNQLVPEFNDKNLEAKWDFSEVPALRDERLAVWERANAGLRMGGITVNEYRKEIGLETVSSGDVFLRQLNLMEVPLDHEEGTGGATPKDAQPDKNIDIPAKEETDTEETDESITIQEEGEKDKEGKALQRQSAGKRPLNKEARVALEKIMKTDIERFLKARKDALIKEVMENPTIQMHAKERDNGR